MADRQSFVQRIGHTGWFAAIGKRVAPRLDRLAFKLSRGKRVAANGALPTLMLEHTGRRSGKTYLTPLSYVQVGDAFALAGSNWGQAHHPAWSANLIANPDVTATAGGTRHAVRARLLSDAEKAELWPRFTDMWPAYDTYDARSGARNIRVFLLEPR